MLIVGGGVIGLTCAYELAREGLQVTLVERGEFGREASWAGAGMIPPGGRVSESPSLQRLADDAAARWGRLSQELRDLTGIDNEYYRCGSLHVPPSHEMSDIEWQREITDWSRVPQATLSREEIAAVAPLLANDQHRVLSLPTAGQVRNPRHLQALQSACETLGVTLLAQCDVVGFQVTGERIIGVQSSRGLLIAEEYLVTAGAWTGQLLGTALKSLPAIEVDPVRGQILLLKPSQLLFDTLIEAGSRYLVPAVLHQAVRTRSPE